MFGASTIWDFPTPTGVVYLLESYRYNEHAYSHQESVLLWYVPLVLTTNVCTLWLDMRVALRRTTQLRSGLNWVLSVDWFS